LGRLFFMPCKKAAERVMIDPVKNFTLHATMPVDLLKASKRMSFRTPLAGFVITVIYLPSLNNSLGNQ